MSSWFATAMSFAILCAGADACVRMCVHMRVRVCACVYVFMCVGVRSMLPRQCPSLFCVQVHTRVCVCVCICVCACAHRVRSMLPRRCHSLFCVQVRLRQFARDTHTCVRMCVHMRVRVRVCACACVCVRGCAGVRSTLPAARTLSLSLSLSLSLFSLSLSLSHALYIYACGELVSVRVILARWRMMAAYQRAHARFFARTTRVMRDAAHVAERFKYLLNYGCAWRSSIAASLISASRECLPLSPAAARPRSSRSPLACPPLHTRAGAMRM